MGLNESYSQIRSSILARYPIVTVNEAQAVVSQEESQRTLGVVDAKEAVTLQAEKSQTYKPSPRKEPGASSGLQRFDLFCEYCGYRNHKKDNCYRLIGYPPGFQSHKRDNSNDGAGYSRSNEGVQGDGSNSFGNTQNQPTGYRPQGRFQHNSGGYRPPRPAARGGSSGFRPRANSTYTSAKPSSSQGHFFSDRQYDQMLHMMGNEEPSQYSANLAGIPALLSSALHDGIIDTGASHHATPFKELLTSLRSPHAVFKSRFLQVACLKSTMKERQ